MTLFAVASVWRQQHGVPLLPALQGPLERELERARIELPPASTPAWGEGETATIDEAIELAFTMTT